MVRQQGFRPWLTGPGKEGGLSYRRHRGGQHVYVPSNASDPWYAIDKFMLTTLEDFGLLESEWVDWDEVEDWEVRVPLRMSVHRDYLDEENEPRWFPGYVDETEIELRDLVTPQALGDAYGVAQYEVFFRWMHHHDFPMIQGFVDSNDHFTNVVYDRADCYEWVAKHYPKLRRRY